MPWRSNCLLRAVAICWIAAVAFPNGSRAAVTLWNGSSNNRWSNPTNWSPGIPNAGDELLFANSAQTNSTDDIDSLVASGIRFAAGANAFSIDVPVEQLTLSSTGVVNQSGIDQHIYIGQPLGAEGRIQFDNSASAGQRVVYVLRDGGSLRDETNGVISYRRGSNGVMQFNQTATAGSATISLEGGRGNGATGGQARFTGNASAGTAFFTAEGGRIGDDPFGGFGSVVSFANTSTAANATFVNNPSQGPASGGGFTHFSDFATAASATFINSGGTASNSVGGSTVFTGDSTAATARIINNPTDVGALADLAANGSVGLALFAHNATAGTATFTNVGTTNPTGAGGRTRFIETSTAGFATFNNEFSIGNKPGITEFFGHSNAGRATLNNHGATVAFATSGVTRFYEFASAGSAVFNNDIADGFSTPGATDFHDDSTAANGIFIQHGLNGAAGGAVRFFDRATAGNGNFIGAGGVSFEDDSNAGSASFDMANLAVSFRENASARNAVFRDVATSSFQNRRIEFSGNATADHARFDVGPVCGLVFSSQSTGGDAVINLLDTGAAMNVTGEADLQRATIDAHGSTIAGALGASIFFSAATAGDATIRIRGSNAPQTGGASAQFFNASTAGRATITIEGGTNGGGGGQVVFNGGSQGGTARFIVNDGALLDVAANGSFTEGTTIGSLESTGATGTVRLGRSLLVIGTRDLPDTTFRGVITDGTGSGSGGRLTKKGTGTARLLGQNLYTGLTTVEQGRLVVSRLSGPVVVMPGASFSSGGRLPSVKVNEFARISAGPGVGTLTVDELSLSDQSILEFDIGATSEQSDHLIVTDDLLLDGVVNFIDAGGGIANASFIPLLSYSGTLIDNGLQIGDVPTGRARTDFALNFSVPGTIGVTIVPEPASFALLIIAVLGSRRPHVQRIASNV